MFISRPILIRVVIPADQSGQIPERVLRLSHNAKKIEALGRGDRRYGTQVTVAFGGMRSGVGGARRHPSNLADMVGRHSSTRRRSDVISRHANRAYSITSSDAHSYPKTRGRRLNLTA